MGASPFELIIEKGNNMNKTTMFITGIIISLIIIISILSGIMAKKSEKTKILLETNMGNITLELYSEQVITSGNFRSLVENGVYNGVIFHRVIDEFMIQGGDPTGTGYGDPNIPKIRDEFNGEQENNRLTIAMANANRPNTGSSQFFINLVNNNFLDGKHPVFGRVIEGIDVVDAIAKVSTDSNDKPLKEVKIISAKVI